jgi:tetratricopeptide (TPR) repeat protein
VSLERDKKTQASRWCAGCHDPVPFFSGAFDNPEFDDVNDRTAHAGISCTVCHAITHVNSPVGNAAYTIEEPQHYPFATSTNPFLQWVNNQLVKAKPDFHKKTFLKPLHKTAEFCSTCHKVSLPVELNHYKEFLRGQNHYDSYLLSGVSGVGTRSFYYPPVAKTNCAECHMPLKGSLDFGSKDFDQSGQRKVHNHLFPAANNGLPWLLSLEPRHAAHVDGFRKAAQVHEDFLRGTAADGSDRKLRIDLFGLKEGGTIEGKLLAPLRPQLPTLEPGKTYLVEVVVRTLNMGHPFTQGTVDSNEIWVDFQARSGGRVLGRSGALRNLKDDSGPLDEWAHRVNVLMLDRHGNRINRRNPQDIFTPLYNHQIPPGASQVVHYRLEVPQDVKEPIELSARLRYRKFDFEYLSLVYGGDAKVPRLPIVDLCADRVVLPVKGVERSVPSQKSPIEPAWQRWNDYGIGCLIEGGPGEKKGELRQAEAAFKRLTAADMPAAAHAHGWLNAARVYVDDGRLDDAVKALNRARQSKPPPPWWTLTWFKALVALENARTRADFDAVVEDLERILDPARQERQRKFDFRRDYIVINKLGLTLFNRAQLEASAAGRDNFLVRAVEQYERTLAIDPEDLDAHYGLHQCFHLLGLAAPSPGTGAAKTDEEALVQLSATLRDPRATAEARLAAAAGLTRALTALGREPTTAAAPKLPRFEQLSAQLRPAFHGEADPAVKAALAAVLGHVHRGLHAIYKPDDLARARATRLYREKHPAANLAAEAIVIYPLSR